MPIPLVYLDECMDPRLAAPLGRRFSVTTARAEGTLGFSDEAQLEYAVRHGRLLVSHDHLDFRRWHAQFRRQGRPHAGIALVPPTVPSRRPGSV